MAIISNLEEKIMFQSQVIRHPVFDSCIRGFDVLQRVYMRVMAYISPTKICSTVFGARFHCNTRQFVQRRIRYFGIFEHNLTYFTQEKLREGDVYVDIGANVGYFSVLASRCVGKEGKVISIEADPQTYAELLKNIALNNCLNIDAKNVAATETRCKIKMNRVADNSGANSVVVAGDGDIVGAPLAEILGDEIGRVHFIKIDIEGSEAPVLRQILAMASKFPEDLVIAAEISADAADQVAHFAAAGFRTYAIQNAYGIDYYLLRSYLSRYGEDKNVHLIPVNGFHPDHRDYIFERRRKEISAEIQPTVSSESRPYIVL